MLDGKAIRSMDATKTIEKMINIVTADAIHCQKETAEKILNKKEHTMF